MPGNVWTLGRMNVWTKLHRKTASFRLRPASGPGQALHVSLPLVLVLLACTGCVSTSAPSEWLPSPPDVPQSTFGGWIEVEVTPLGADSTARGELIAVEADTVFVLSLDASIGLQAIGIADILAARLAPYDSEWGAMATWTMLGTLSTASHGWFLLLSFPTWFVGGGGATAAQSRRHLVHFPQKSWSYFRPHARFPQGLPPGLDRATLKAKLRKR